MKFLNQIAKKIDDDIQMQALIKVILVLFAVFLIRSVDVVWMAFFRKAWRILRPFILGFAIAYVIQPLIRKLETSYKISRKITIPVFYVVLLVFLFWLCFTLVPLLYSRLSSFITSMITGLNSIYNSYISLSESAAPLWMQRLMEELISALQSTQTIIPELSASLPAVLSNALDVFTIFVLTIIVSVYMCFSWESIRTAIYEFAKRLGSRTIRTIKAIDIEIGTYIRSLLVLIAIKFAEYAVMYYFVGHKDWLLVSLLTAIGLIVPYIGPMLGNTVGILTALTLPTRNVIILLVCIVVLSQLDAYVIEPLVHSRNVKITPLWALFAIYAGGVLAGGLGIMAAIPTYLAIRAAIRTNSAQI